MWSDAFARYFFGVVHYERNELTEAKTHLEQVVRNAHVYPIQNVTHAAFLLSLTHQAQGRVTLAREVVETIAEFAFQRGNRQFFDLAAAFRAELDWRQGRASEAYEWARGYECPNPHAMQRFFNAELTWAKVMVTRDNESDSQAGTDDLERLRGLLVRIHQRRLLIDVLGLKAVHAAARMDDDTAVAALREAVTLSQPGLLIRPLADLGPRLVRILNRLDLDPEGLTFVGSILAAIRGPDVRESIPRESQPLIDPLSPRELEILDLLADALSNREIAEQLYISPGTVKRHAHNIYEKLAVSGRRAAVAKARGLELLESA